MTYDTNQRQKESPHSPSTDSGDDDRSVTTLTSSFDEYSPYENISRQISPISDTSFNACDYSFPFGGYSQTRLEEIDDQFHYTQNVYAYDHDVPIDYELSVPRNTRLPSQEIPSPELLNTWSPIPGTGYYISQTEALSPTSTSSSPSLIAESLNSPPIPPSNPKKDDECEKGPRKRKSGRKPQICQLDDCNKHFRRSAELTRHQGSVHREQLKKKPILIPCRYPGCSRSGENGFKRRDNYMQHLRGPHNEVIPKRKRGRNVQDIPYAPEVDITAWPVDRFEY